jgi:cytochrome c oxidase subunit IV
MATAESQSWSLARYLFIYVCLLIIAGLQFVVGYQHLDISQMFLRMLMLATVEAGLAVLFFMHLWTERRTFVVTLILGLVFVLGMMNMIWWDSFRLLRFRLLP